MNRRLIVLLAAAVTLVAAEADPWAKVLELKSGAELRIQKRGIAQPILAQMDEATEERLVVVIKNEQVSIPKDQIDRIDARPKGGSRVIKETKVTNNAPGNPSPSDHRPGGPITGPSSSQSSSMTFGGKPDFEIVYRRPPVRPAKP
ncbi:MAG TPA: hypothetical protein VER03_02390 [Bryobacteraceae bacterium]|nr:hypothetical protein [Bryobacteraceae bacterium]